MRTFSTLLLFVPVIVLCAGGPAGAVGIPTQDNLWYYEIGGADPVSVPANPLVDTVVLGGSGRFGLGYSCGRFDPMASISNLLENFRQGRDAMVEAMVAAARNLLAALPALILQRAAPDLYDLFQTHLVDAQRRVSLAFKTCEQIEGEIAKGKNPFEDWINLAKVQNWKDQMADPGLNEGGDIVVAKRNVDDSGGDNGLPWLFGAQGGQDQDPIRPIHDTTAAGYNVTQNRARGTDPTTPASGSRLADTWSTPEAAARWAVDVLGDDIVRTCQDCERATHPGTGLLPKYNDLRVFVSEGLVELVSGTRELSFANLDALSAPGTGLSRQLIEAIRALPSDQRGIVVARLAAEIAQSRTIDQALLIRRLLLTGARTPEVAGYQVAGARVQAAVSELEQEIDNLLFETRVRREVVSTTARVVLERAEGQRERSLSQTAVTLDDPDALDNGRVPR